MKHSIKAKIVSIIIISFFIFGLFIPIFTNNAKAMTPGEAVGKAVGAGVACFLEAKVEAFVAGLLSRVEAIPEGMVTKSTDLTSVPVIDANSPKTSKSIETSNALMKSKDCIRDVVAKIILDWIADETVTWIQGGGEPGFVQNWDTFSKDAFNVGVGEVINNSSLKFLCSPFRAQVKMSFLPVQRFQHQISCTLDQITGNIENFYNDFSNGGWLAYDRMWEPQNNYFGAYMMASDEALVRAMEKRNAALNEAVASKGFLGVKKCVEVNQDGVDECIEETCPDDVASCEESCKQAACISYKIITPGDAVGTAVGQAITSDSTWAANIHSWVAAIVNAVINRLTKEGLSLMKRSDDPSTPSNYGSHDPWQGVDRTKLVYENAKNEMLNQLNSAAHNDLPTTSLNKVAALNYFNQALAALQQYGTRNCQPPISSTALNNIQTNISDINISAIGVLITRINNFINYLNGLTIEQFVQQQSVINDQYSNIMMAVGTHQQDAIDKLNQGQAAYDDALQKLNNCVFSTTP